MAFFCFFILMTHWGLLFKLLYHVLWVNKHFLNLKKKTNLELEKIYNTIKEVKIQPKNYMMHQDIYNCICLNTKIGDILSIMSNLQPNCCLKVDFRKVGPHAGGKWLINDIKRHKDYQLQSLRLPYRITELSSRARHNWEPKKIKTGIQPRNRARPRNTVL